MDAGCAEVEEFLDEPGRCVDGDPQALGTVCILEPLPESGRRVGAVHIREPLDRRRVGNRNDPSQHGNLAAEACQLVDHTPVVVGVEEELRDAEVGHLQLLGETTAVGGPIG